MQDRLTLKAQYIHFFMQILMLLFVLFLETYWFSNVFSYTSELRGVSRGENAKNIWNHRHNNWGINNASGGNDSIRNCHHHKWHSALRNWKNLRRCEDHQR